MEGNRKTVEKKVQVLNDLGLHMRPATQIVSLLKGVESDVWFSHMGAKVNAKGILGILTLAAKQGAEIEIQATGADAQVAMDELVNAFDTRFGE